MSRTALVTAGFHHAGARRQAEAELTQREPGQQVNERECGAQNRHWSFPVDGTAKRGPCGTEDQAPASSGIDCARKPGLRRSEFTLNSAQHVDQRGAWRQTRGRGQADELESVKVREDMFPEPRQERRFVERKGFGAVKMPARLLACRSAGMKYRHPLGAGNA